MSEQQQPEWMAVFEEMVAARTSKMKRALTTTKTKLAEVTRERDEYKAKLERLRAVRDAIYEAHECWE